MEVVHVVLVRGPDGYGFRVTTDSLQVEAVTEGGSAALGGLQVDDLGSSQPTGSPLVPGVALALPGRQREGTHLTLTCRRVRMHAEAEAGEKRRRTTVQQPGMRSYDGVRMADAPRSRIARMADRFASGTANSL